MKIAIISAILFLSLTQMVFSDETDSIQTDDLIRTIRGSSESIYSIAFSPDEKILASGGLEDGTKLWNTDNGKLISILKGQYSTDFITFSPDGTTIASTGRDNKTRTRSIILWNYKSGKIIRRIKIMDQGVSKLSIAFLPDGMSIASANGNSAKIWDIKTGKTKTTIQFGKEYDIGEVYTAISPDGKMIATGNRDKLQLWNIKNGKLLTTLKKRQAFIDSITFSPDGKTLAIGRESYENELWDIINFKLIRTFKDTNHDGHVTFSPDGSILVNAGSMNGIKLFDVNGKLLTIFHEKVSNTYTVQTIAYSPDGNIFASIADPISDEEALRREVEELLALADNIINDPDSVHSTRSSTANPKSDNESANIIALWDAGKFKDEVVIYKYQLLNKDDLMAAHEFYQEYKNRSFIIVKQAMDDIVDLVENHNTIKDYEWFIHQYPDHEYAKDAVKNIYSIVEKNNTIEDYRWFVEQYSNNALSKNATKNTYTLIERKDTINEYIWFIDNYPNSKFTNDASEKLYKIISKENNAIILTWFSIKFHRYQISKLAMKEINKIAYGTASKADDLESYDNFIISYPYAEQIEESLIKSKVLEQKIYSGWFSSDGKNARALRVKMKQLETKMNDSELKDGYILVLDRMGKLLQDKFPAEDVTVRFLESNNSDELHNSYKAAIENIRRVRSTNSTESGGINAITRQYLSLLIQSFFMDKSNSDVLDDEETRQNKSFIQFINYLESYGIKEPLP